MTKEDVDPVERLEEIIPHPADKSFNSLHNESTKRKKELADEREELAKLLNRIPNSPPKQGSQGYQDYNQIQKQIEEMKSKISKTHNELMEILKNEEKLSREIRDKNP